MSIAVADYVSGLTGGFWRQTNPAAPTCVVTNDGTGTSVTAAVTGPSGATIRVYYRAQGATSNTLGGSRSGDGNVAVSGLTPDLRYTFWAVAVVDDLVSLPSLVTILTPTSTTSPLAAAGDWAKCFANAATLLANSVTFQVWVAAGNATEAAAHIYQEELDADGDLAGKRPYALLMEFDPAEYERFCVAGGSRDRFNTMGACRILFEQVIASGDVGDAATERRRLKNTVGQILSDMEALSGTGGYLHVRRFVVESGPARSGVEEKATEGHYIQVAVRVEYGFGGPA